MRFRVLVPHTMEDGREEYVQYGPPFLNREAAERARATMWSAKGLPYWGPEQRAIIREEAELRPQKPVFARPAYPRRGE